MPFDIKEQRDFIEQRYIGFSPNTASVKPVHLANGLFRVLLGHSYDTRHLVQFVVYEAKKGVSRPHELSVVFDRLQEAGRLDTNEIAPVDIAMLRQALRKVVHADGAVFAGGMDSHSAGTMQLISNDRIAQDGGEFLAHWLRQQAPTFTDMILTALQEETDPITFMVRPLLGERIPTRLQLDRPDEIVGLNTNCPPLLRTRMLALAEGAQCLAHHLNEHPNKLTRLRMALLFGSFLLVRYMADLEHTWQANSQLARPLFVFDFTDQARHPMRLASQRSFVLVCQAITRFYGLMFADYLRQHHSLESLNEPPWYAKKPRETSEREWREAQQEATSANDPYLVFGEALYDILALMAEATPIKYFRALGVRGGLFWPPHNLQPAKQIAPRQDMLEVLIRSVAMPGDTLDLPTLQQRLGERYGIIIGGSIDDLNALLSAGIYQADNEALKENQTAFTHALRDLNFARMLADGVMEVQAEGIWK
jgi:hypothetical protein